MDERTNEARDESEHSPMSILWACDEKKKMETAWKKKGKKKRRCRGSNPGHPRDRREYLPLYYNDFC